MTTVAKRIAPAAPIHLNAISDVMLDLYRRQLADDPEPYLIEHAEPRRVAHQARVFRWYAPYLPPDGAILDLGCAHGPDACMLRKVFGERFELHGCDFWPNDKFRIFREFSGMRYAKLTTNLALPYLDETFDVVVASGVLEHAAMDYELLKEIYRILKPDAKLIVSYLPNRFSREEWVSRNVRQAGFHRRLYGIGETMQLLKRTGFFPIVPVRHQSFAWEKRLENVVFSQRWIARFSGILRFLFPVHVLSSTLCGITQKVQSM
jgi:ubiquinone/menaquinone biosynthesis C-methylase UbiE